MARQNIQCALSNSGSCNAGEFAIQMHTYWALATKPYLATNILSYAWVGVRHLSSKHTRKVIKQIPTTQFPYLQRVKQTIVKLRLSRHLKTSLACPDANTHHEQRSLGIAFNIFSSIGVIDHDLHRLSKKIGSKTSQDGQ